MQDDLSDERGERVTGVEPLGGLCEAASPDPQATAGRGPVLAADPPPTGGLTFRAARTLDEVIAAWRLVYTAYTRSRLIGVNVARLHTAPQAVGPHATVILGQIAPLTVSTLTAIADGPAGLPLDRVYAAELAALRRAGRRLMEIGLFADRRKHLTRAAEALFQLMRLAFHLGLHSGVDDFIIGVHPRHARFYCRAFGFETVGSPRTYPAVNDRPVVLLRGDMDRRAELSRLHPVLRFCIANPLPPEAFADRCGFEPAEVAASPIAGFLRQLERRYSQSA